MRLWKIAFAFLAVIFTLQGGPSAALDPERSIGQLKQTRWKTEDGAPGPVIVIAQGRSGYLWIGTRTGLYRFDGVSFESISAAGETEPRPIVALLETREGDLWVGYSNAGGISTALYRDGVLRDVPMPDGDQIMDFVQTRDGSVWAALGRKEKQLMRFQHGQWREAGTGLNLPAKNLGRMIVARNGTIWICAEDSIWFLRAGANAFEKTADADVGFGGLAEDAQGNIWLSDKAGSRVVGRTQDGEAVRNKRIFYPVPNFRRALHTTFDDNGNLWGKTQNGIFRVKSPKPGGETTKSKAELAVEAFHQKDGLTSDLTYSVLADREGNVWFGTEAGLDRFRAAKVVTEPLLRKRAMWGDVLLGASDGSVYIGEADAVYRVKPHGAPQVVARVIEPHAICEGGDGSIWIAAQESVFKLQGGKLTTFKVPVKPDLTFSDCAIDRQGQLWLAAERLGIFKLVGRKWQPVPIPLAQRALSVEAILRTRGQELLVVFDDASMSLFNPPRPVRQLLSSTSRWRAIRGLVET